MSLKKLVRPPWSDQTSKKCSEVTRKSFYLIFFPAKAEIPYFSNLTVGGPRGDLGRRNFSFRNNGEIEISGFL